MKLLCLLKASFTAFCLEARLKEPFDDNLRRLNEDMSRLYPQDDLVFRSMEQMLDNYAESVRVFRDVTLWASVTIVDDEIRLRSKEIAIRKVNGAETSGILRLLSRDVLWISIPSVVLGTLVAYEVGQIWISQFSDVVLLPIVGYISIGFLLLAFIVGCVVMKSWHVANENPVNSIKSE